MNFRDRDFPAFGESHNGQHYVGHTHFWERALLSRRQFMLTAAGTTGAVLSSGLWMPGSALAWGNAPRPIPGGFKAFGEFFHVDPLSPGPAAENSTIFDFHGSLGAADVRGTGTGTNNKTGITLSPSFSTSICVSCRVYTLG